MLTKNSKGSGRDVSTPLSDLGSPVITNLDDAQVEVAKLRAENAKLRVENKKLRAKLGRPKGTKEKGDSWYVKLGLIAEDFKQQGMTDQAIAEKLREEVPLKEITSETIRKQISQARHHPV